MASRKAILMVEFYGDTQEEASAKAEALAADLKSQGLGYTHVLRHDAAGKARVWQVRKNGLGLMLGMKGDRRPTPSSRTPRSPQGAGRVCGESA